MVHFSIRGRAATIGRFTATPLPTPITYSLALSMSPHSLATIMVTASLSVALSARHEKGRPWRPGKMYRHMRDRCCCLVSSLFYDEKSLLFLA